MQTIKLDVNNTLKYLPQFERHHVEQKYVINHCRYNSMILVIILALVSLKVAILIGDKLLYNWDIIKTDSDYVLIIGFISSLIIFALLAFIVCAIYVNLKVREQFDTTRFFKIKIDGDYGEKIE